MSENDKLKRDLNAQLVRAQELEKSLQTYRPQLESLRQENDNLSHARTVDLSLIARRDRKIEELKTDLLAERQRREAAERSARQRALEKDEASERHSREIQAMIESTKHATVHAEILETSHRQLGQEYKSRAQAWRRDITALQEGREQDRKKLARLDVVSNQMRREFERNNQTGTDIVKIWEKAKKVLIKLEEEAKVGNARNQKLGEEMEQVVNEMRWVMRLHKHRECVQSEEDKENREPV